MADDLKELALRLERLEEKLDTVGQAESVAALTEEDIAAYHKVQNAVWEDGSCGINESSPCVLLCNVFKGGRIVKVKWRRPPINECTCGPCMLDNLRDLIDVGKLNQLQRFGGLGGGF